VQQAKDVNGDSTLSTNNSRKSLRRKCNKDLREYFSDDDEGDFSPDHSDWEVDEAISSDEVSCLFSLCRSLTVFVF
jgi:hypothetical protein